MSRRAHTGFSLLELSVVLVIIAVVLAFGLNIANSALKGSDRITTQTRLTAIQRTLDAYARVHGHLPCPSSRANLTSAAGFGVEARKANRLECTTSGTALVRAPATGSPFIYIGAVPVRTLGLPDHYASDAWGNKFTYGVSASHIGSLSSYVSVDGPISISTGNPSGTNYTITTQRESDGTNAPGPSATYVVVSQGKDAGNAWPMNSATRVAACSATAADRGNCDDSDVTFWDNPFNDGDNAALHFDDYIVWGSNLLDRMPTVLGGVGIGCGTGPCERWCAPCDPNFPPTSLPYAVCTRTITSTSPCKMLCEYAYPSSNVSCP